MKAKTKEPVNAFTLFKHFFLFSTFAFGGGTVIIAMIKERFVNRLKWIDDDEMNSMLVMSQSAPGAVAINVSVLVAYRLMGIKGVLIGIVAALISPITAICIVVAIYNQLAGNAIVKNMMHGVKSAAAALIFVVVCDMIVKICQKKNPCIIGVLVVSFMLIRFLNVNIMILIIACTIAGIILTIFSNKKHKKEDHK